MEHDRRSFIKAISLLSISLGLNPLELLANNVNGASIDQLELFEEVRRNVEEFNYVTQILNADPNLLQKNYNKLYKVSTKISDDKFRNYNQEKQIKKISRYERRIGRTKVSKEDIRNSLINNSTSDWVGAMNALSFGYSLTSTIFSGVACAASIAAVPYGAGVPAVATTCPVFLLNAGFTSFAGTQLVGNTNRANKALQHSSNHLVNLVKNNPSNKFLNSNDYTFKVGSINLSQDSNTFQLPTPGTTEAESDFQNFLREKLSNGGIILNEDSLKKFLEGYVEKVGKVQTELITEYIERSNKKKSVQQRELKEKVAFYQSLGRLTSVLFNSVFPPKEAEILSILTNVGFEYMATGIVLGPMGWGAVGIQIASVLLSSKNKTGEFQNYVLKALEQINFQLETINKKLDDIYYNQIEILVELHKISSKIDSLSYNVLKGLESISGELNDLSISIDQVQRNRYYIQLKTNNLNLKDELIDDSSIMTTKDVFNEIRSLRNAFSNHLSENYFTNYIDGNLDGNLLKKETYESFNYLTKVSLYDKVGLIPAAYNFSPEKIIVQSKKEIYHPLESYLACQNITSWLTLSKLNKKLSRQLIEEFEIYVTNSISLLNQYSNLEVIISKSQEYKSYHHSNIANLYKTLNDDESILFSNSNKKWLKNLSLTPESYFFKADPLIGNNIDFTDNKFDEVYFDVLLDFGLIKRIREIGTTPVNMAKRSVEKNEKLVGREIGNKVLEIEFGDLILNHKGNKGTIKDLKINYKKVAICKTEEQDADYLSFGSGITENSHWVYYSTPKTYSLKTNFFTNWKSIVKTHYIDKTNQDINIIIENFDSISFSDFAKVLILEYVNKKKNDLLKKAYDIHYKQNAQINGIGTSLLLLSQLNKTINSDSIYPFVIDYIDETYVDFDFERLFDKNYFFALTEKQENLKIKLEEISETFLLEIDSKTVKLNINSWKDYICLLIKHRIDLTISRSLNGCEKLKPNDAEPYLADSLNKLNWFKNNYLKLKN